MITIRNICVFKLYNYIRIYNTWKYIHISKEMWNKLEVRKRLRIWPTHQHGTVLVTANAVPLVGVRVNIQADEQGGRCRMLQVAMILPWFIATLKTTKWFMTITILAGFLHVYLFGACCTQISSRSLFYCPFSTEPCSSALPQGFHSSVDPICDAQKSVFYGPKQLEGIVPTSKISKALCSLQQLRSRLVTQFFRVLWPPKLPCVLWQSHERLMKN